MKTKVLIISFLIVALCGAFALKATSQDSIVVNYIGNKVDSFKELIADETWLSHLKTGAKITTTSEAIFQQISLTWGTEFQKIIITYKHANKIAYKEYVIITSTETGNNIRQWAKKNL